MFRIALFGAGRIGKIHAANISAHPELTLSHVVDVDAGAAAALAAGHGALAADIETVLGDKSVDAVLVATSTDTHLDLTVRAHDLGKFVFCEKPVDLDLDRALTASAHIDAKRVFVGFNRRFDPNFSALQARIGTPGLGALETLQITSNDPAPPPVSYVRTSGGLFADMTIHDFDMARFLLGEDVTEIFAWGSSLVDPAIGAAGDIDTARILLKTATGKLCVIANSRRSGFGYDQRVEAFCAGGMISAGNMSETTVQVWSDAGPQGAMFQNFFLDRYAVAFRNEIAHFADVLARRALPLVTFDDGVAALALATAAKKSLTTGQPVMVSQLV
jgi:myo-inositol 2-dehydrogenase/D-chiro-inositol 1-dehydrogenase